MKSKELLKCLFESSSLRQDLLNKVEKAIYDLLDNIHHEDEIIARVNNDTYDFIKDYIYD